MEKQWPVKREQLLREAEDLSLAMADLDQKHDQLSSQVLETDEAKAEIIELELDGLEETVAEKADALSHIQEAYRQELPLFGLSRCPFSGDVLYRSIDLEGLDGFFWDYNHPIREDEELLPTLFAMDGALKLGEPLEGFSHTVCVGPEVPFVLPRLLQYEEIRAVLSSFSLGGHRLYLISYFAEPFPHTLRRVNDLGSYCYRYKNSAGLWRNDFYEDPRKDFDLETWIRVGRLQWIDEGDENLSLRSHLLGCPYLNLPGQKATLAISSGVIEETEPLEWIAEEAEFLPEDDYLSGEEQEALFDSDEEVVYEELDLDELEARLEKDRLFYEEQFIDNSNNDL